MGVREQFNSEYTKFKNMRMFRIYECLERIKDFEGAVITEYSDI